MHYTLENHLVHASVYLYGGMTLAEFTPEGRRISPLFLPAWATQGEQTGFLENLRGDFPCVPFGGAPASATLPEGWNPDETTADPDAFAHGYGAHHRWELVEAGDTLVRIGVAYPRSHPIEGVIRTVSLSANEPKVFFEDQISVRSDCRIPIGLHPVFRLPEERGMASLCLPDCRALRTYPGRVDTSSIFAPDAIAESAQAVPLRAGGVVDATRLPMDMPTEELLMLCGVEAGRATLENRAEGYRTILEWDAELLPNCLLWFSNRGRSFAPWNGQNLCLGIEPIASAFDLGTSISLGKTPLDTQTSLSLGAGDCIMLKHAISAEIL